MCIVLYMKLIWCNAFAKIYAQLEEGGNLCGVMVLQRSMLDWRSEGGGKSDIGILCIVLYIYRSAMRCAKFGVEVLQTSMLNWGVNLPWVYVHCAIYETFWCNAFAEIYVTSAMRCAKCGVAVLKASLLNWGVSFFHGYMFIVLYMKLMWCNGFAEIYA